MIHSFLLVFTFDFASTSHFINNMPRVKQSPRKNPRDLPNPTNWASILRNNHCKYFYLNFCSRMWSDGCILRLDRCILRRDGYKPLILKTCTLLYIINLFNFAVGCGGTDTCCGGMGTFCRGGQLYVAVGRITVCFNLTFLILFPYSCQQYSSSVVW